MNVETRWLGSAAVVDVSGDVDMHSSPRLRQALRSFTGEGVERIVVNLEGVDFMDSSGIATLVQALREVRNAKGSLRLAGARDNVLRVLKLSNLIGLFEVFDTVEEAAGD
jgi:anti-sigma B factor antagonist